MAEKEYTGTIGGPTLAISVAQFTPTQLALEERRVQKAFHTLTLINPF